MKEHYFTPTQVKLLCEFVRSNVEASVPELASQLLLNPAEVRVSLQDLAVRDYVAPSGGPALDGDLAYDLTSAGRAAARVLMNRNAVPQVGDLIVGRRLLPTFMQWLSLRDPERYRIVTPEQLERQLAVEESVP